MGRTSQLFGQQANRKQQYEKKEHPYCPLYGRKRKWCMWSVKFMAIAGIKGYHILLRGSIKTPAENTYETKDKVVNAVFYSHLPEG